jgi:predicted lipid-binding transport protein (Tim44 family)/endogenous inhibitor of DNA gyrase (YacG/DUF329 family)
MKRLRGWATLWWLLLGTAPVWARVGGGQSFSGGHSGGGSGGGGGGGGGGADLIWLLIQLVFNVPQLGVPLLAIVLIVWYFNMASGGGGDAATFVSQAVPPPEETGPPPQDEIDALRRIDPNFSEMLFLDFVQLLYVRFHEERGQHALQKLAPYVDAILLQNVERDTTERGVIKVENILVGASRVSEVRTGSEGVVVNVTFESNFGEITNRGPLPPQYLVERWMFTRKAGVLSKGPDEMLKLGCPNCGNPSELKADGTCPYCNQVVNHGDFNWLLASTAVVSAAPRPPLTLESGLWSGPAEVGTDDPSIVDVNFQAERRAFMARNPDFSWPDFENRVRYCFTTLQQAWSSNAWEAARAFETDHLFNLHRYQVELYRSQGLANRLDDVRIEKVAPVKLERDAWFDAITVRIWASMKDYVVDQAGQVRAGDPRTAHRFSEYWTFIRSSGAKERKEAETTRCPHCGAPLKIGMTGICEYCGSKITSGVFDWVLATIVQSQTYRG